MVPKELVGEEIVRFFFYVFTVKVDTEKLCVLEYNKSFQRRELILYVGI